jgi:hypothetical protein
MRYTLLTISILFSAEVCAELKPVSVCEALAQRATLNGKTVSIRGLQEATGEGAWLSEPSCSDSIAVGGRPAQPLIWLEMSGPARTAAGFDSVNLQSSVKRINARIAKQGFDPRKDRLWVTYVGLFWSDLGKVQQDGIRNDDQMQPGFGPLNAAPTELVVKDVSDPLVERPAKSDQVVTPKGK